jgi:hypothetical protein
MYFDDVVYIAVSRVVRLSSTERRPKSDTMSPLARVCLVRLGNSNEALLLGIHQWGVLPLLRRQRWRSYVEELADERELLDSHDELAPRLLWNQILNRATSSTARVSLSLTYPVEVSCVGDEFLING